MTDFIKTFLKRRTLIASAFIVLGLSSIFAQAPLPPPPGQNPPPPPMGAPVAPSPANPIPPAPNPQTPPGWGAPGALTYPPAPGWMNQGTLNVMATGYDSESVLVQIPLVVSYSFNGVNYNVTVLNSWNPYSQTWNIGVDAPAYQGSNSFNGFTYNYLVTLPSGTYYFNL